jgi:hypothetical protein
MFENHAAIDESPTRVRLRRVTAMLPHIVVGGLFVVIGYTKFEADPNGEWFRIFEQIGLGQWLRYVTGGLQIAGGLLLPFRRTLTAGAVVLGSTMVGAVLVDLFLLGSPLVVVPLLLLFVIATLWVTAA